MILTTIIGTTILTSSLIGTVTAITRKPIIKINGQEFKWDETEIYAGETVKSESFINKNVVAWFIIIAGTAFCIWWMTGGYLSLFDVYKGWWKSA